MKKRFIVIFLIGVSLSVAAFAPDNNSDIGYTEIKEGDPVLVDGVSSFTKYEHSHESADKVLWSKRNERWDFNVNKNVVSKIETSLNNN